jgi:hypothetical protein
MRYRLELVHEAATEEGRSKVIDGRKEASLSLWICRMMVMAKQTPKHNRM